MDVTTTKIVVLVIIGLVITVTLLGEIRPWKRGKKNEKRGNGRVDVDTNRPGQAHDGRAPERVGAGTRR